MEDIEDVLGPVGLSVGGAPPVLRLLLASVAASSSAGRPGLRMRGLSSRPGSPARRRFTSRLSGAHITRVTVNTCQVRKNKFIEILPINVGCLGACTYCKTKHARGHLGSYTIDSFGSCENCCRLVAEGVREIWLSSQ
uniref:Radical SAM core domain-containing protein n=1 Tax=Zea mays TaxID=4577 RepID=C0PJ33_MAIZE|nr:unknown [Zea mays]|eukprot:NP_001288540.1 threonylcarbamoyladenosine tRNA methylthiotransferase-like [Zea mays]